jgi:RecG-like helicase
MVPTEILAEQHFRNLSRLLAAGEADYRLGILTDRSALTDAARTSVSDAQIVSGHALFGRGAL